MSQDFIFDFALSFSFLLQLQLLSVLPYSSPAAHTNPFRVTHSKQLFPRYLRMTLASATERETEEVLLSFAPLKVKQPLLTSLLRFQLFHWYLRSWLQCPESDQRISFFVNFPFLPSLTPLLSSFLSSQPATYFIQMSPTAADANGGGATPHPVRPSSQSLRLPLIPVSLITIPHAVPRETGFLQAGAVRANSVFWVRWRMRGQKSGNCVAFFFFPWHRRHHPPHPLLVASSSSSSPPTPLPHTCALPWR